MISVHNKCTVCHCVTYPNKLMCVFQGDSLRIPKRWLSLWSKVSFGCIFFHFCAITELKVIQKHWCNVSCFRVAFMLNSKSVSAIGPFNQIRTYFRPHTSLTRVTPLFWANKKKPQTFLYLSHVSLNMRMAASRKWFLDQFFFFFNAVHITKVDDSDSEFSGTSYFTSILEAANSPQMPAVFR